MVTKLEVLKRDKTGKSAAKKLRREGFIPAIGYGHGEKPTPLMVDSLEFENFLKRTRGESVVVDLKMEKTVKKAIIKYIERDPLRGNPIHIDFLYLHKGEEITVNVPIILAGEAKGTKLGGVLEQVTRELAIKATPNNIPPHIEVDITQLEIGDSIHIKDLSYDKFTILNNPEDTIVTVSAPKKVVEEVPVVEEEVEIEGEVKEEVEETKAEEPEGGE